MKHKIGTICLALCLLLLGVTGTKAQQTAKDSLPYQKHPTLPAFNIRLLDSTTLVNTYDAPKDKPVVLMFFSPDCDHCEMQTDSLIQHMDQLKNIQFYLCTPLSLMQIRTFYNKLHLERYANIVIGRDDNLFFPAYFGANYVPFLVVYDKKHHLIKAYEGGIKVPELLSVLGMSKK